MTEAKDIDFLNSIQPDTCPYCNDTDFKHNGKYGNGTARYYCKQCRRSFSITTETLFENSHHKLIEALELTEEVYTSAYLKTLEDKENPLERVNRIHYYLKHFLHSHISLTVRICQII